MDDIGKSVAGWSSLREHQFSRKLLGLRQGNDSKELGIRKILFYYFSM